MTYLGNRDEWDEGISITEAIMEAAQDVQGLSVHK